MLQSVRWYSEDFGLISIEALPEGVYETSKRGKPLYMPTESFLPEQLVTELSL